MMAGDNQRTADAVAKQLGIDQVFAELMPEDKATKVKELQSRGKIAAMAGDVLMTLRRSLKRMSGSPSLEGRTSRSKRRT